MRKILVAFDGSHYSTGVLEFANRLNEKEKILLTGAFLPQVNYANLWSYADGGVVGNAYIPLLEDEETTTIQQNIEKFQQYCRTNSIEYTIHKDFLDFALPELKRESRFADLLIISSEVFYEQFGTGRINEYLQEALHKVECPVLLVPEKFDFPLSNILTYDGSAASVYAIKQFSYLFPEFAAHDTMLVQAKEDHKIDIPELANIRELANWHFPNLTLLDLEADPKKYFSSWVMEKKSPILVSGAFGRSDISRLFRKSFITEIVASHRIPVFIAHR